MAWIVRDYDTSPQAGKDTMLRWFHGQGVVAVARYSSNLVFVTRAGLQRINGRVPQVVSLWTRTDQSAASDILAAFAGVETVEINQSQMGVVRREDLLAHGVTSVVVTAHEAHLPVWLHRDPGFASLDPQSALWLPGHPCTKLFLRTRAPPVAEGCMLYVRPAPPVPLFRESQPPIQVT